jgi:RNA polymerase sigma factor (sigma-70 family)
MLLEMNETDLDLLSRYTRQHAEDAFAEIVGRHLDLVYSAALRQLRSRQLAEEVAQSAFADLARNAARLKPDTILTAWLYQVTRRTAIDVVRREARRQLREQIETEQRPGGRKCAMSFALWAVDFRGIRAGVRTPTRTGCSPGRPGRLGAEVALLQSPTLPAAGRGWREGAARQGVREIFKNLVDFLPGNG